MKAIRMIQRKGKILALSFCLFMGLSIGGRAASVDSVRLYQQIGEDTKLTRTEQKNYPVNGKVNLNIDSKYGEIIVKVWEKQEVEVKAVITAYGKDVSTAERVLERISLDWRQNGNQVRVYTAFDRNASPIKELWKKLTDEAEALLNRSKVEINYEILVPANTDAVITHKYGDVFLGKVSGNVEVDLGHGLLQTDKLSGITVLNLNFANANIQEVQEGDFTVKGGRVVLYKANKVSVNSAVSELDIREVNTLILNSRSDQLSVGNAKVITGQGRFSKMNTAVLSDKVELDLSYGNFKIERIVSTFSDINITSNATDIQLVMEESAAFDLDITAIKEQLQLPSSLTQTMIQEESKDEGRFTSQRLSNHKKQGKAGKVSINANGGDVDIKYIR